MKQQHILLIICIVLALALVIVVGCTPAGTPVSDEDINATVIEIEGMTCIYIKNWGSVELAGLTCNWSEWERSDFDGIQRMREG